MSGKPGQWEKQVEEKPGRRLPKKSKRPKRRYILFRLVDVSSSRQAFGLVMKQFGLDERKALGVWFIGFEPATGKGIVRCGLGKEARVRKAVEAIPGAKTLKTSGTLKALKGN